MLLSSGGTKKGRTDSENVLLMAPPPGLIWHCSQTCHCLQGDLISTFTAPCCSPPWLAPGHLPSGIHLAGVRWVEREERGGRGVGEGWPPRPGTCALPQGRGEQSLSIH